MVGRPILAAAAFPGGSFRSPERHQGGIVAESDNIDEIPYPSPEAA